MPRSAPWFLLVVCLVGLLLARESRQPGGALAGVDRAFLDWLAANAHSVQPTLVGNVTLVEIDESVTESPGRLPLSPLEYAGFLQAVGRYDPAVVGLVPVLDWVQFSPGTEEILLDQALHIPRLLLATHLGSSVEGARDPAALTALEDVAGSRFPLAEFPEILAASDARLRAVATASAADNLPGNERSPVRDLPLVFRHRDRVVPGFALQTLTLALRLAPVEVKIVLGSHIQFGDRLRLPIDRAGRALLDVRAFERINRLSFDDLPLLAAGQAGTAVKIAAERMRGGVVVLGRTDRTARTLRLADGRAVSPAEVFAWAAVSLSQATPIQRVGVAWDAGIIAVVAVLGLASLRLTRASAFVALTGGLIAYALGATALFEGSGRWLPVALPLGLALTAGTLKFLLPSEMPRNLGAKQGL